MFGSSSGKEILELFVCLFVPACNIIVQELVKLKFIFFFTMCFPKPLNMVLCIYNLYNSKASEKIEGLNSRNYSKSYFNLYLNSDIKKLKGQVSVTWLQDLGLIFFSCILPVPF